MNQEIMKLVDRAEDFYQDSQYLLDGKRYEAVVNRKPALIANQRRCKTKGLRAKMVMESRN